MSADVLATADQNANFTPSDPSTEVFPRASLPPEWNSLPTSPYRLTDLVTDKVAPGNRSARG
jgi:hypothetical protein